MKLTIKESRQKLGLTQQKMSLLLGMIRPALAKIEVGMEGRKETKGHIAHLAAIELIFEHGLLDELAAKLKE